MKIITLSLIWVSLIMGVTASHSAEKFPAQTAIPSEDPKVFDSRVGMQIPVFSEIAKIYESPTEKAKILGSLPIGTPVKVVARMTSMRSGNGFQDAWLKVESISQAKPLNGFIWGGELAIAALKLDEKNLWLAGILGMKKPGDSDSYEKLAEVRLVSLGKIVSRVPFEPVDMVLERNTYSYTVKAEKLKAEGFSPPVTLIALNFRYEADDYPNGDIFFTWNGKQLNKGPEATVTNSADYLVSTTYTYLWPNDRGGSRNCLTVKYTETQRSSEDGEENAGSSKPVNKLLRYAWNGVKLAAAKQCPK